METQARRRLRQWIRAGLTLIGLIATCVSPSLVLAQQYSVTRLPDLGGGWCWANAINDYGWVVGRSTVPSGEWHAALWIDGHVYDLGTLGSDLADAYAVNNNGQVVGWGKIPGQGGRAFIWDSAAGIRQLGEIPGANPDTESWPVDINDAGQVVGQIGGEAFGFYGSHGFLWQASTGYQDLGLNKVGGINNRGQIAGAKDFSVSCPGGGSGCAERHVVLLSPTLEGTYTAMDLSIASRVFGEPVGINDSGQIALYNPAALWDGAQWRLLGTLPGGYMELGSRDEQPRPDGGALVLSGHHLQLLSVCERRDDRLG